MVARTEPAALRPFAHEALATSVVFGPGRVAELGAILDGLSIERAMLIDGLQQPGTVARIEALMGARHLTTRDRVRPHVPVSDAEAARRQARELGADGLVALGGGSATGLAKAVALADRLPIVAIPTTYAGSEMTPIWGMTEGERKTTGRDVGVLPRATVYDPELTYSLPPAATASSGMNAIAHCVEAVWTDQANPLTDALAAEGIALLAQGLRDCVAGRGDQAAARATAMRGAWLGGVVLASAGTALHHKLCHVLGGLGLPHADVHAAVLPPVTAFIAEAAPASVRRVARALEAPDAAQGLSDLASALGADATLADLGLTARQARTVARLTAAVAPPHPRPATEADVLRILQAAGAPR